MSEEKNPNSEVFTLDKIEDLTITLPEVYEEEEVRLPAKFDPLQKYLQEISKYPVLSREEEEAIAKAYYETKDPKLAYKLVISNLRLVVKIAFEFQKFWAYNFLDLVQEGNLGLLQAVKKFDPYKGVKFSYYASFFGLKHIYSNILWITGSLLKWEQLKLRGSYFIN